MDLPDQATQIAGPIGRRPLRAGPGFPNLRAFDTSAVFWNYLSVVFQSIGDTITWERWEGTLEYTMMAPVRRSVQLLGSALYAVVYGLIHTTLLLIVLALFFSLDLGRANIGAAALFMTVGSASFIGIGMLAAILPMMSVERGSQMVFVLQSCLLLVSGVCALFPTSLGLLRYTSELWPGHCRGRRFLGPHAFRSGALRCRRWVAPDGRRWPESPICRAPG